MANDSATLLIQHRVLSENLARYEAWLRKIMVRAAEYPGHQGVHVFRPPAGGNDYCIVIRYEKAEHASRWLESEDRRRLLEEIEDALEQGDRVEIQSGIEFWFTPQFAISRPVPGWKQWLVTSSVIWPLTMFVPLLFNPLFKRLPILGTWGIQQGILALAIVAIVVFVVMPRYVRLLGKWLYQ